MDGLATVVSEMQMLVVEQWVRLKELAQRMNCHNQSMLSILWQLQELQSLKERAGAL